VERWQAFKDYTTICHSAPSEVLGLMALRARQTILARNLEIIQANLAHMEAFCADYPQLFRWLRPDAGSVAFPAWTGPGTVNGLAQALVDGHGVMVAAGSLFDDAPAQSGRGQAGGHFRVGLGRRNFPEALAQVRAYLRGARLA
jgi:aspartate/methionine/tyrosine aminotransferase